MLAAAEIILIFIRQFIWMHFGRSICRHRSENQQMCADFMHRRIQTSMNAEVKKKFSSRTTLLATSLAYCTTNPTKNLKKKK